MLAYEGLELRNEREMTTEFELGVDARLDGRETQLLEPLRLDAGEALEFEISERPPLPERLRGAKRSCGGRRVPGREHLASLHGQPLEVLQVELTRLDP